MVAIHSPLSKKHSVSLNFSNLNDEDKSLKKNIKLNKIKKSKHFIYDIYNHNEPNFIGRSSNENYDHLKNCSYSFNKYEEQIIPRIQNNTKILLKRSKNYMNESEYIKRCNIKYNSCDYDMIKQLNNDAFSSIEDKEEIESNFHKYQYGTLIGNKSVANCMKNYLANWSTFISEFNENNNTANNDNEKEDKKDESNILMNYSSFTQEELTNNSGYLTPISQKDNDNSYDQIKLIKQDEENVENSDITENEIYSEYSPLILDDFDDVCPFENNYYEDERIREVLNAKVLPSDYIGKIPSLPERPMGDLGKLMEKYKM